MVALIDDGVDTFDKAFTGQVLEGKSLDYHNGLRPPYSSARGHGTVMASMILRVCPMAKIYPIRLKIFATADSRNQIVMDSAAQAIEAALDKKATIISMSWTLPISSVDVVKEQFGSGVSLSDRITSKVAECQYETGSSVATALGAGLAAMVLYCVKAAFLLLYIANVNKGNNNVIGTAVKPSDLEYLAKPDGMKWAFSQLGKLTKDNFIPVWEQLDPVSEAMEQVMSGGLTEAMRDGKDGNMERFWDFASSLVRAAQKNQI
ncbi:hypothetical protein M406DRAFT_71164 [Cryphonectria parasitica EP155]|uniref:Peptidase S8/S53 domain-containing protein n=1 Tax=Cryphonectria parasitica (strain ATCC 38755 / EP155) TaxID=660469 RepID=A0A9P5CNM7_CRYP1|nr:uncharacterized protein M406DRAFT_71164 [Cryphonectria parasitica EP155]KAF3764286.1 hypothetical protein M406DRAFT_71164 [Cryphonectria parasitica EP155]